LTSKRLKIGETTLTSGRIDPKFARETREAVKDSKVRKGRKATARILDQWSPSQPLTEDQYEQFKDFASGSSAKYRKLESEWWDLHKADPEKHASKKRELKDRMALEAEVLHAEERLKFALRESTAQSAVKAIAGTLVGAPGLVAAYTAHANGSSWTSTNHEEAEAVLGQISELDKGESEMITEGNRVKQVHREDLWKSMNDLMNESIKSAKNGKPVEVGLQLYELTSADFLKKVAASAKAGNKIRVNLDPGRLAFPSKDSEGDAYFSLDATPDKIRTIIQLTETKGADVGVSLFPQKRELNSASDLMHRKLLRVGDKVLISGMNANMGSGENVDSGYIVKGKGARKLGELLIEDVQKSKGATLEDIWGTHHIEKFDETNLRLGKRGFVSLLETLDGPAPAGTEPPKVETVEELEKLASKAGLKFSELINVDKENYDSEVGKLVSGYHHLQLSEKGEDLLKGLIQRAIEVTNTEENLKALDDMSTPSGRKVGETRVDIASTPVEREALILSAISQAEEFVFLPGFVVTRAVAASLAARKNQLAEQGKDLDVRVVADSAIYPHGGNPNSYGVKMLEDHGIQPRWAKLERSGDHDRKIHAKQLITERGEITGSTNFSNRGIRENWETSAYIHFDKDDSKSLETREESVNQFLQLWDNSYELSSVDHARYLTRNGPETGRDWFVEQGRERSIRHVLRLIGNYERESGKLHQQLLDERTDIADRKAELEAEGYSYGDATLKAVREVLGEEKHKELLESLPATANLNELQEKVTAYKEGREVCSSDGDCESEEELTQDILFY